MRKSWLDGILLNRGFLWLLFAVNFLGTVYGYIWYGNQLAFTAEHYPVWLLPFVPDSPTASLFFTVAVLLLLFPPKGVRGEYIRRVIEALAVLTSIKYGIWAVGIIFAGGLQGDMIGWQDWMLVVSHTAMAIEALLYARYFAIRSALPIALAWTLLNDAVDYSFGVFPWLPRVLEDDVIVVQWATIALTLFSFALSRAAGRHRRRSF